LKAPDKISLAEALLLFRPTFFGILHLNSSAFLYKFFQNENDKLFGSHFANS